jgi:hypothetical protein
VSFKVLVVPEDPTFNGLILKPLVQALLADAGRAQATVKVLDNPRVQGYEQARAALKSTLIERYRWMDLWLFMPDADKASATAMAALEQELAGQGVTLLCCAAQPELEAYACAPFSAEVGGGWVAARQHSAFKEAIFVPLLAKHGNPLRPGGGRDLMIDEALRQWPRLLQLCPELKTLRDRIAAVVNKEHP